MMGDRAFSGELQDGCSRVPPAYGKRDSAWFDVEMHELSYTAIESLMVFAYMYSICFFQMSLTRESSFLEFIRANRLYSV